MPDQILVDIFTEHLPYEVDMLRHCFRKLQELAKIEPAKETLEQKVCRHALMEAFAVHARSLRDFLADTSRNPNDAVASDFTGGYKPTFDPQGKEVTEVRRKLNKLIFHLTKDRTTTTEEKFDVGRDGVEALSYIEPSLREFARTVKSEFGEFKFSTPPIDFITVVPSQSSTSSMISYTLATFSSWDNQTS